MTENFKGVLESGRASATPRAPRHRAVRRVCELLAVAAGSVGSLAGAQDGAPIFAEPPLAPAAPPVEGAPPAPADPGAAMAGTAEPEPRLAPLGLGARRQPIVVLTANVNHVLESDFNDDSGGSVTTTRLAQGVLLRRQTKIDERITISLGLSAEETFYEFNGLPAGNGSTFDPEIDAVYRFGVAPGLRFRQSERLSWSAGLVLSFAGEPDVDFEDGFTYGITIGGTYEVTPRLSIGGLLLLVDQVGADGELFFPVPVIRWQISDRWSAGTDFTLVSRGAYLAWEPRRWLEVRGSYGVAADAFRLDSDGPGQLSDGVIIDRAKVLTLSAAVRPTRRLEIVGRVGLLLDRELEFEDSDGREFTDPGTDAGLLVGLDLRWAF